MGQILYLDDDVKNLDPWIVSHAQELGADIEKVLTKEVHNESFSKDIGDSLQQAFNS